MKNRLFKQIHHEHTQQRMKNDDFDASSLKHSFDKLSLDDKAAFLLRAAFSTASTAVDEIGHRISDLIDSITESPENESDEASTGEQTVDADGDDREASD
jgi:hypothetical protein